MKNKRILIACEYSGTVRDAFEKRGWDAWSSDLLPADGKHIQGDATMILHDNWDMMIAHPPCTHIASSGAAHFKKKIADGRQQQGINLFMSFVTAPIQFIAIENPIGVMSSKYRKPDQIIHPYQFGEPVKKSTCLWLKGLPKIQSTEIVAPKLVTLANGSVYSEWDYEISKKKHSERGHLRSKTFQGIADAMADQWTNYMERLEQTIYFFD